MLENYRKKDLIEARTLLEMVQRQVTPAVIACAGKSAAQLAHLRSVGLDNAALYRYTQRLSKAVSDLFAGVEKLRDDLHALPAEVSEESNRMLRDTIRVDMEALRDISDGVEQVVNAADWPMPTYTDLMHRV